MGSSEPETDRDREGPGTREGDARDRVHARRARFVTAGGDKFVRVWETATGKEVYKYPHEGPVYALAVAADGKRVLAGGSDKTVRLWQLPVAP